jgi:hypothetical protein
VVNLFALRSTDRTVLLDHPTPISATGSAVNDHAIRTASERADLVVCGWGIDGVIRDRSRTIRAMLGRRGLAAQCLGLTKTGEPKHPLYIAAVTPLTPLVDDSASPAARRRRACTSMPTRLTAPARAGAARD